MNIINIKFDVGKEDYNNNSYYVVIDMALITDQKNKLFFFNNRKRSFDSFTKAIRFIDKIRRLAKRNYGISDFKVHYTIKAKKHIKNLIDDIKNSDYELDKIKKAANEYNGKIEPEFERFLIKDDMGLIYSLIPKIVFSNWNIFNLNSIDDLTYKIPENKDKYKTLYNIHTIKKFIEQYKEQYHYSYALGLDRLNETFNQYPNLIEKWNDIYNRFEFKGKSVYVYQ